MEQKESDGACCPPGCVTSDELLQAIPSSEDMQAEVEIIARFVQKWRDDPDGLEALNLIADRLAELPLQACVLTQTALTTLIKLGNFCNAGGQILFVDPPKPQERTNGTDNGHTIGESQ